MRICLALCLLAATSAANTQNTQRPEVLPQAVAAPATKPAATTPSTLAPAVVKPQMATPTASPKAAAAAAVAAPTAAPAAPPAAAPGTPTAIRGQLSLSSDGRPLRSDEAVDAVVYFRPAVPVPVVVPLAPLVITTERKTFVPRVLPVPVGASVRFPNSDPILHNVFSTTKEATFDLGLYGRSDGESYRFTQPGVIKVFCNVHHAMVAHVLVMDTPFFTKPDAQGRFRLVNVPSGPGELFVWHERSQLWHLAITAGADQDISVPLELSKRRVPPHLNKTGQPYRRTRPDEY